MKLFIGLLCLAGGISPRDAGARPRGFDPVGAAVADALPGARANIPRLAASPDGKFIAAAGDELEVLVWSVGDRKQVRRIALGQYVRQLGFTGDSAHLIASAARTLFVYRVSDWSLALSYSDARATPEGFASHPRGGRVAFCRLDRTRVVYDLVQGKEIRALPGRITNEAATAWSPDGRRIAGSVEDLTVRVWDAESGEEVLKLGPLDGEITAVAFSPEGGRIAASGASGVIKIWDAATGSELRALTGHSDAVKALAWCTGGPWIVTAGVDGTVRVWDASRGRELRRLQGHAGLVGSFAFLSSGRTLLTAGTDGKILFWSGQSRRPTPPESGTRKSGYLGILGSDSDDGEGATITEILQGGAAERYRIVAGETIVEFNGHRVRTFAALAERVRACGEGDEVKVLLKREGKEREVHVRLGARPEEP